MEPSSLHHSSSVVPKLHLFVKEHAESPRGHAPERPRVPRSLCDSPGAPQPPLSNGGRFSSPRAPPYTPKRVVAPRVNNSTVQVLDSTRLPRMAKRNVTDLQRLEASHPDEFCILHPALDLTDDNGELSQLMLSKWSVDAGEDGFSSLSLFCEMKLSEAKRMASWVEAPNRFFVTVCCQLLHKYVHSVEASNNNHTHHHGEGSGGDFLRRIHDELLDAIFLPSTGTESGRDAKYGFEHRVPYFVEYKRLKKNTKILLANFESREKSMHSKLKLPGKIEKVLEARQSRNNLQAMRMNFRAWKHAVASQRDMRNLKIRMFRKGRKLNLTALFRAWRIEALRRAYQRESVEYQTMLSITAASLSRKDVLIGEAEAKIASFSKIIESLTESNAQLLSRIERLESGGAVEHDDSTGDHHPSSAQGHRRPDMQFEHIDTLLTQDDDKMDRVNRMLLEAMFGMARMVESSAIQMSKDVMDSLEYQLDGSVLQNLMEMIQSENLQKYKSSDEAIAEDIGSRRKSVVPMNSGYPAGGASPLSLAQPPPMKPSSVKELAQMPIDAFLLSWFRMNLQMSTCAEKPSDRTVKNFTSDLTDGRRYGFLLHRLFPTWFDRNMVHEIDSDERLKCIAEFHSRVQPELPQVVTSDSIHAGSVTENVAFVAMLFGSSIGSVRKINLERQRGEFLNIITSWKRVRSLMLEVKRMQDNYDSLMVVHLLKEMRTCETLFKQLNSELSSIAIASNEGSSALSQVAYKILHLTWSCLNARSTNTIPSLNIIDERFQERIRNFSFVDVSTVRQILMAENEQEFHSKPLRVIPVPGAMAAAALVLPVMSLHFTSVSTMPIIPEREVLQRTEAVRLVVSAFSKDLHDIFKHYSASGGAGSVANMSLPEYNKFVKDCCICDKKFPPVVAEFLYRAALFHSPNTPRELVLGAMAHAASVVTADGAPLDPLGQLEAAVVNFDLGAREMVGLEFVDVVIRLAAAKYSKIPLEERFRELMEQLVLPNALRSQSEIFRAEISAPKVRTVFQKHKASLQRVFRYYASMHTLREQQSTLDLKEFTIFSRDCKLIGTFVTEHTLKQILANIQRDTSEHTQVVNDNDLRVDYNEFLEAIAALTEFVICNPYVPLYKRIEQFINEMLLPRARQRKKAGAD
ncbi:TPA: hypothetical protein N0F65_001225 [Lagenidium giganteum]|uniref:Calponin-homology (CH) domain-containing protein n=1 Tax=Lagenidium giganteum TaxID=4803 RepID=A0AAV2Z5D9_9STRA|nr:TPA: hypothetical protein N0F65_001225 [Lagenidium giganteum]